MVSPVVFSSKREDWATPQLFFDDLDAEFGFKLDAAAHVKNAKCSHYISFNSLEKDWTRYGSSVWLNPPYGRKIGKWVKKASETAAAGTTVVCLLPARVDTKWFHDYVWQMPGVELRFVRGRLRFEGAEHAAPFPSMVVIFHGQN